MILDTAEKMYRYFLTQVRKEHTVVVPPAQWNEFINPVILDWVKIKLPENEFNQKRIDDLEALKVLTDNEQYQYILAEEEGINRFVVPYESPDHPPYLHGISASFTFRIFGVSDTPPDDELPEFNPMMAIPKDDPYNPEVITDPWGLGSEKIKEYSIGRDNNYRAGRLYRSDTRVLNKYNPYRQPDDKYLYFETRQGKINLHTENNLWWNVMILEYYCYPEEIIYLPSQDKPGSFKPTQNKEIMDLAVTKFLENVSDPRIQTQPSVQVPS